MAPRTLNFVSFNITGFKDRNYNFIQKVFSNCDVLMIQETWLYNCQHHNITNVLKGSHTHAVSAMRDDDVGRMGRPYGGCAIVWHSSLALTCRPVATTSPRLCAVTAEGAGRSMLWVSVYMPNDDNTHSSYEIYGDVLSELSGIIQTYEDYDIVIGGDFNVDFNRPSRNLALFSQFISQEELQRIPIHNNMYTFESAIGSRSSLDCFFSI